MDTYNEEETYFRYFTTAQKLTILTDYDHHQHCTQKIKLKRIYLMNLEWRSRASLILPSGSLSGLYKRGKFAPSKYKLRNKTKILINELMTMSWKQIILQPCNHGW